MKKYISLSVFIKIIEVFVILAVNYVLHISFNIRRVSIGTENKLTLQYNLGPTLCVLRYILYVPCHRCISTRISEFVSTCSV